MIITVLQVALISLGLFFLFAGVVGLIRLPDVFTRMHATTNCDTMGVFLVLAGLMLRAGGWANFVKLGMILGFLWFTSPTVAHLIGQAAWLDGVTMYGISGSEGGADND